MKRKFEALKEKEALLKRELIRKIVKLPDNPKIKRLDRKRAFTMNLSDLGDKSILAPEYHSWKTQHRRMVELIKRSPDVRATVEYWIRKGVLVRQSGPDLPWRHKIHPGVIEQISKIWNQ